MVQDRCPDIVQASSSFTVDVLTEIRPDMVMQNQVEVEEGMGSGVSLREEDLMAALSEGYL